MLRCREGKVQGMVPEDGLRERQQWSAIGIALHSRCINPLSQPCHGV